MKYVASLLVVSFFLFYSPVYAAQCANIAFDGSDADLLIGYAGVGQLESASPFTPSQTCTIDEVGIRLAKSAGRTEDASVRIYQDSSSLPGTLIEACGTIPATYSTYPTFGWATSTCAGTTQLSSGVQYWIGVASASTNDSLYLIPSAGGGPSGTKNWNGSDWTTVAPNSTDLISFTMAGTILAGGSAFSQLAAEIIFLDF